MAFSATNGTPPQVSLLARGPVVLEFATASDVSDQPAGAEAAQARIAAEAAGALVLASGDDVVFVCASAARGRDRCCRGGLVYVVVHRSHGAWTHVYRVVRDPRSARLAVFVERAIEGDRLAAACEWAWAGFAA